jgi:hypothetical protein
MTQTGPFLFLVILLAGAGIATAVYRHQASGMPFLPGAQQTVWQVEARVSFNAHGGETEAILTLPPEQPGFRLVDEKPTSSGYGFAIRERRGQRQAHWSKRQAEGSQVIFYKLELIDDPTLLHTPVPPAGPAPRRWDEPYQTAARDVIDSVLPLSAGAATLAEQLVQFITTLPQNQNVALLLERFALPDLFANLMAQAGVPARRVQALALEDGRRRQSLIDLVQVWDGQTWLLVNPLVGVISDEQNLLLWQTETPAVLEVMGGTRSRVTYSIISQTRPALTLAIPDSPEELAADFSLYSLPIEEQSMFKLIMLLPVGALVVVFMRVMVGITTSGTFMPVLIAMAFLQTELIPGVLSFLLVVSVGLMIRSYLSILNLLLVARIATLVIVVIGIISVFSVISYRLGLLQGLTITFFPMIILAWTIERMSILWEEEGGREVLIQGGGSLLVAVAAHQLMDQQLTRHLAFNFPELHLVVLALIMVLGRYKGYRLSELLRFAAVKE